MDISTDSSEKLPIKTELEKLLDYDKEFSQIHSNEKLKIGDIIYFDHRMSFKI